jgi:hypothetical protein
VPKSEADRTGNNMRPWQGIRERQAARNGIAHVLIIGSGHVRTVPLVARKLVARKLLLQQQLNL